MSSTPPMALRTTARVLRATWLEYRPSRSLFFATTWGGVQGRGCGVQGGGAAWKARVRRGRRGCGVEGEGAGG